MNTLKNKVLLIKTGLLIFLKAMVLYLLVTLPALAAFADLYEMSALYAIMFGWIAGLIFTGVFYFLEKLPIDYTGKCFLLCVSVLLAVGTAFQMMEVTGAQRNIWQSGAFLLFPLAAVISGWLSILLSRHQINKVLSFNHKITSANDYCRPTIERSK